VSAAPSPLASRLRHRLDRRHIHPPLIRLTISVSDDLRRRRIAASGEGAANFLDSTPPGGVLQGEGHAVSDRERQRLSLRLHRPRSSGVAREGGEDEQDRDGPRVSHVNLLKAIDERDYPPVGQPDPRGMPGSGRSTIATTSRSWRKSRKRCRRSCRSCCAISVRRFPRCGRIPRRRIPIARQRVVRQGPQRGRDHPPAQRVVVHP
jgi:hypothetical protein